VAGTEHATGAAQPKPWREVVQPHPDVAQGRFLDAEFAADLAQVYAGTAGIEYGDAREFFNRTYLTKGLQRLLVTAVRRVAGLGGEPAVGLQTAFGGGKTHAMLALYHLLGQGVPAAELAGGRAVLEAAGVTAIPTTAVAVLAGTDLSPGRPWPSKALGGQRVHTLWGELAAQIGGVDGYAQVRAEDEQGVPPGAGALALLLDACGPCVVLIDELVAFMRPLYEKASLSAGSFDANLTFVHNLTEAVKRSRAGMVVATIPESDIERGGEGGRAAAERIEATFGRLETIWRPVAPQEGPEIVRRRLFQPVKDGAAREAACRAFAKMYADGPTDFPPECRTAEYLQRLRSSYPIHPEVFDRLYDDWSSLERFQRTRGVLRLMAAALYELWQGQDPGLLILPGSLPLHASKVRDQLTRCLDEGWNTVVEADVDGARSGPAAVERENPRFGKDHVARRVARTVFLGSAPSVRQQRVRGMEQIRVRLGTVEPRESVSVFGDALGRLRERLTYLYSDGSRLWFDTRPNLIHQVADRAAGLQEYLAQAAVHRRLQASARRRADPGVLGGAHAVLGDTDPPEDPVARLVVLPLTHGYPARGNDASPAVELAARLLGARARHANMVVFLAADRRETAGVLDAARQYLAWVAVRDEAGRDLIHLDDYQRRQVQQGIERAEQTLSARLHSAYHWILAPVQEGTGPIHWDATRAAGEDDPVERATRRIREERIVQARWSPAELRLELDRWFWKDASHVEVRKLWQDLTKYLYLPRLGQESVLMDAIAEGVESGEYFGYAEGVTPEGRYLGLKLGAAGITPRGDGSAVLVRPEVARTQLGAAATAGEQESVREPERQGGAEGEPGGYQGRAGGTPPRPSRSEGRTAPTRFYGTMALDPAHTAKDACRVAEEIVQHLAALLGAQVAVTLEIEARVPGGLPEGVVRVVRENAAALKFRVAEFEAE